MTEHALAIEAARWVNKIHPGDIMLIYKDGKWTKHNIRGGCKGCHVVTDAELLNEAVRLGWKEE
jgi:TusA-related sulfurtransferase